MTDKLKVYAYNVLFGDAILVEVPDGQAQRFILIDVGNALSGKGGEDQPLLEAIKDIQDRTAGKIDLYVMTHEHMDHVQGLLYASQKGYEFQIDTVWMTASSEPRYYQKHPGAKKKRLELQQAAEAFQRIVGMSKLPVELMAILEINSRKTDDCVDFIRQAGRKVYYLYRRPDLKGQYPFTDAAIRILAPEEDTSVYYRSVPHFELPTGSAAGTPAPGRLLPLPGIDGGAFYELIERMDGAFSESVFAIDQAANNTSLVFELTWRQRRLLFTGDAELKSWQKMAENTTLRPVDLLKIGHHGSHNAAPPPAILDQILPPERQKQTVAILSTYPGAYPGVPDQGSLAALKTRTNRVYSTEEAPSGKPVVVTLEEGG